MSDLTNTIATISDAKEWIECMAYSPDGNFLAVGAHDSCVYVYDVNNQYG